MVRSRASGVSNQELAILDLRELNPWTAITDAIAAERRMKNWTREKKLAHVAAEW